MQSCAPGPRLAARRAAFAGTALPAAPAPRPSAPARAGSARCVLAPPPPVFVQRSVQGQQRPDKAGRFGVYGGKYVPETLIAALAQLEEAYGELAGDAAFQVRRTPLSRARPAAQPRSAPSGCRQRRGGGRPGW